MDLTQLANLGEFIGGLAVVLTLIYLALQVRQNTQALRRSSARQTSVQNSEALRGLAGATDLLVDGFENRPKLPATDRIRFDFMWTIWMQAAEQTFADVRLGLQDPSFCEPYREFLRGMLSTPEGRDWWLELRPFFDPNFNAEMEALRANPSEEAAAAFRGLFADRPPS